MKACTCEMCLYFSRAQSEVPVQKLCDFGEKKLIHAVSAFLFVCLFHFCSINIYISLIFFYWKRDSYFLFNTIALKSVLLNGFIALNNQFCIKKKEKKSFYVTAVSL